MKNSILLLIIFSSPFFSLAQESGFLFFGDTGTGESIQYKVAGGMKKFCEQERCDFVALLGDNFYPSGVESTQDKKWQTAFEKPYGPLNLDFFASLGNHDYKGNVDAQIKYTEKSAYWKMPARYYTYSRGPIDFFVIDTNNFDKHQKKWLTQELEKSRAAWKIAYGHHPIYSYGSHGNNKDLISELLPLLEGQIDFYLAGHDHDKEVIEKKDSAITFIVSGAAAKPEKYNKYRKALFTNDTLGFAHFRINDKAATLKILDEDGDVDFSQVYPVGGRH